MRKYIDIINEKQDRWAILQNKYGLQLAQYGKSVDDFRGLDPSPTKVQWLIRSYSREPFDLNPDVIHEYLSLPNTGDIMSYSKFSDFEEVCQKIIAKNKKVTGERVFTSGKYQLTVDVRTYGEFFELYDKSKSIGTFLVDLTHRNEGFASMHSNINPQYQRLGLGTMVYNWVENYVAKQGYTLRASANLTQASAAFWKKRNPEAMAHSQTADF